MMRRNLCVVSALAVLTLGFVSKGSSVENSGKAEVAKLEAAKTLTLKETLLTCGINNRIYWDKSKDYSDQIKPEPGRYIRVKVTFDDAVAAGTYNIRIVRLRKIENKLNRTDGDGAKIVALGSFDSSQAAMEFLSRQIELTMEDRLAVEIAPIFGTKTAPVGHSMITNVRFNFDAISDTISADPNIAPLPTNLLKPVKPENATKFSWERKIEILDESDLNFRATLTRTSDYVIQSDDFIPFPWTINEIEDSTVEYEDYWNATHPERYMHGPSTPKRPESDIWVQLETTNYGDIGVIYVHNIYDEISGLYSQAYYETSNNSSINYSAAGGKIFTLEAPKPAKPSELYDFFTITLYTMDSGMQVDFNSKTTRWKIPTN